MAPTFAEAIAVSAVDSHTYTANFLSEWCIGSVTHGGVVTATLLQVAKSHFSSTLSSQNQPHTIAFHAEFLRRTNVGPATFKVRNMKLGRMTSTVHVTLIQDGREEVVAYITNSHMGKEQGMTFPTHYTPHPPLPPKPKDFTKLASDNEDEAWALLTDLPHPEKRKAVQRVRMYVPKSGSVAPNIVDEWIRLESGESFPDAGIGFVSDMWPQMLEGLQEKALGKEEGKKAVAKGWYWYPTLTLSLDSKKPLPEKGTEWLHVRVMTKMVKNGRYDYEIVVFDMDEEIVALSHHIALAVDGSRNLAKRRTEESKM
ncbi:thioesterase-like superfamily-domain-containing protein [Xylariaceae sp. FL1019]|nr:thioesterase-like superfamily-domain-containing protein [Xylariaceae sp. FL1019]